MSRHACPHCGGRLTLAVYAAGAKSWAEMDWTRSNSALAKLHGLTYTSARQARQRYAPETIPDKHDWSGVDWTLSNREIGIAVGVPPYQVSYHRYRHAPHTVQKYKTRERTKGR